MVITTAAPATTSILHGTKVSPATVDDPSSSSSSYSSKPFSQIVHSSGTSNSQCHDVTHSSSSSRTSLAASETRRVNCSKRLVYISLLLAGIAVGVATYMLVARHEHANFKREVRTYSSSFLFQPRAVGKSWLIFPNLARKALTIVSLFFCFIFAHLSISTEKTSSPIMPRKLSVIAACTFVKPWDKWRT